MGKTGNRNLRIWDKSVFNKLKKLDPEIALELSYRELQKKLGSVRQELKRSIEKTAQIENRLQKKKLDTTLLLRLNAELQLQNQITAGLKELVSTLEHELQVAYTKKQVLIACDKAHHAKLRREYGFCLANPLEKEVGTLMLILRRMNLRYAAFIFFFVSLSIFLLACFSQ